MGNDNDVDILPQSDLREAIDQQMREFRYADSHFPPFYRVNA